MVKRKFKNCLVIIDKLVNNTGHQYVVRAWVEITNENKNDYTTRVSIDEKRYCEYQLRVSKKSGEQKTQEQKRFQREQIEICKSAFPELKNFNHVGEYLFLDNVEVENLFC